MRSDRLRIRSMFGSVRAVFRRELLIVLCAVAWVTAVILCMFALGVIDRGNEIEVWLYQRFGP